jgi:hypothetical protein
LFWVPAGCLSFGLSLAFPSLPFCFGLLLAVCLLGFLWPSLFVFAVMVQVIDLLFHYFSH